MLEALVTVEQLLDQHLAALQQRSGHQLHDDRVDPHLDDLATRNRLLAVLEQQRPQTVADEPVTEVNHRNGSSCGWGRAWLMLCFSGTERCCSCAARPFLEQRCIPRLGQRRLLKELDG